MPTSYEIQNKPKDEKKNKSKKPTVKDLPGSGLLKNAGEAIKTRQAKRKELLNSI